MEIAGATVGARAADDGVLARTDTCRRALHRNAAVRVTFARLTTTTRLQAVAAKPAHRAACVGRLVIAGQLQRTGHVLTTRALTGNDVTYWIPRSKIVAVAC